MFERASDQARVRSDPWLRAAVSNHCFMVGHNQIVLGLALVLACLVSWAEAQHTTVCGARSCQLCTCSNGTCPDVMSAGSHLALFYNTSLADFSYEFESYVGPPSDLIRVYLLSPKQYDNYLGQLPFSYYTYSVATARSGACYLATIDTKGRGLYIVFECANPSTACQLWFRVIPPDINQCSASCPTGSVDNGVCDFSETGGVNCLASSCDVDGQDCIVTPPPPVPPPVSPPPPIGSPPPVTPPPPVPSPPTPATPPPPGSAACPPSCPQSQLGDGDCDNQCNYAGCNWDNGDCDDPCEPNPCSNGGTCSPDRTSSDPTDFNCDCEIGWCGDYCTSKENLNSVGIADNDYCESKLRDCEESHPDSDVYFCCEYKLLGSDSTCRSADAATAVWPNVFA